MKMRRYYGKNDREGGYSPRDSGGRRALSRSHEPIAWSLFGAGGRLLAFIGPGLIVTTAMLPWLATGDPAATYASIESLLRHPLGKLAALAGIALPLYHTAHRLYHGLHDLHLPAPARPMQLVFYGGATVLSGLAAWWLVLIGM